MNHDYDQSHHNAGISLMIVTGCLPRPPVSTIRFLALESNRDLGRRRIAARRLARALPLQGSLRVRQLWARFLADRPEADCSLVQLARLTLSQTG
jgi:hypothetical protein